MKRIYFLISLLLLASLLIGCGTPQEIEDAKGLGQSYYEALKANDFEKAMSFYSLEFFKSTSKGDTLQIMQNLSSKLGDLQSYEYDYYEKNSYVGTQGSYTRYNLYYDVIYSKGSSRETLTLTKSEDGKFEILGFNIDSVDLIK